MFATEELVNVDHFSKIRSRNDPDLYSEMTLSPCNTQALLHFATVLKL